MSNLMAAHNNWASRPADERFKTLAEMHNNVRDRQRMSVEDKLWLGDAHVKKNGTFSLLERGIEKRFTNWSAMQFLQKLSIPKDFINTIDNTLAEQVIKNRLMRALVDEDIDRKQRVLGVNGPDGYTIRALHSSRYERLWDAQVTGTLMEWLPKDWRNPVAFAQGKWGAPLEPSGLYAGDRDMFAFFIDGGDWADKPVGTFDVDGDAFNRGFYVWNSEVGAKSFGFSTFNFRVVCGNNIIWGASNFKQSRARHIGGANDMLRTFRAYLASLQDTSKGDAFINAVRAAKTTILTPGNTKSLILQQGLDKFKGKFTQTEITDARDASMTEAQKENRSIDGSAWFWLQGFTAVARTYQNADERTKLEETASKVLLTVR